MRRSCYSCQHQPVCRMHDSVSEALGKHRSGFVNVDLPANDEKSWIRVFDTLAVICTKFTPLT